jgi:hypothetical protein
MIPFGDRQHRPVKKTYVTATNSDSVSDPYNFVKTAILPPSAHPTLEASQDSDLVRQQWTKGKSQREQNNGSAKNSPEVIAFIKIDFQHQNLHCVDKHPVSPRSIHNLDAHRSLS